MGDLDSINDKRNDLASALAAPYIKALETVGIGPSLLARVRKEGLTANKVVQRTIEGPCDVQATKYTKVIAVSDKHTVLESTYPDHALRRQTARDIEVLMGFANETAIIEHQGNVAMTFYPPQPTTIEAWEREYQRMASSKAQRITDTNGEGTHKEE